MQSKPYDLVKRLADILFSALVLILASPVMVIAWAAVKLTSPGPALYMASRIGRNGKPFKMAKFRTMSVGADKAGPAITASDDVRITPVGRILRGLKIDELPQFWNVLKGEMSVIGPRPNVAKFTDAYSESEKKLLNVPQGITDYASLWFRDQEKLHAGTGDAEADYERRVAPTKIRLGIYYAEHYSMGADVLILLATIGAVVFRLSPLWCFPKEIRADSTTSQASHPGQPVNL